MDDLVKKFNAVKTRLDKFERNFKKCSSSKRTKGYLEGRLSGIDEIWTKICEADKEINLVWEEEGEVDVPYFTNDEFSKVEDQYFTLLGQINEFIDSLNTTQTQSNGNRQENNQQHYQREIHSKVKLPKIELPSFSGSYSTWMSFKNRFTNLIHDNEALAPIEKLEYLKSCVVDKAEKAIARYQITNQNYKLAWDHLNGQYDNQRILQITQVETIIDRTKMKQESAVELRDLLDVVQECLEALQILKVDVSTWDIMLIVLITRKLPVRTRELWEEDLDPKEVPTYKKFIEFLEKRYRTLESLELIGKTDGDSKTHPYMRNQTQHSTRNSHRTNCVACDGTPHSLLVCEAFLNMSMPNRHALVNAKRMCKNCLAMSHTLHECNSNKKCFKCGRNHHTLLHRDETGSSHSYRNFNPTPNYPTSRNQSQTYMTNLSNRQYQPVTSSQNSLNVQRMISDNQTNQHPQINQRVYAQQHSQQSTQNNNFNQAGGNKTSLTTVTAINASSTSLATKQLSLRVTLFPTAIIKVKSVGGTIYHLRALLDQCSDEAYIKESVAKMLGLKPRDIPAFDVTGLADAVTSTVNKSVNFEMVISKNESMDVEANVIKSLVGVLPKADIAWNKNLFENINLADPNFATSGNVDVMLGSEQYTNLILDGMLKKEGYLAQNTRIGWIISGKGEVEQQPKQQSTCLLSKSQLNVDGLLRNFWEIEEAPKRMQYFTEEEERCEEIFKKSYRRTSNGRVQVKLPFKEEPSDALGASRNLAVARWIAMEKKLYRNPELKSDYMQAMQEHLDLGHMTRTSTVEKDHAKITTDGLLRFSCYYIPHHAIIKEESKTTKTRIVFDASAKTSSKKSLNDILMVGATIQDSLLVQLMKWRRFMYVLRGDITKMYKQIQVYDEDVYYQRLVMRFNKEDPIEDFQLKVLTFGTASAPFMAIRTLKQLASDESTRFPVGSKVVESDFHVDDLLTGGDSIEEVKTIWRETKDLLGTANFPMRKWSSNNNQILEPIPEEQREIKASEIQINDTIKTLGMGWLPIPDQFFFTVPQFDHQQQLTKRNFLSQAARLFDPLGWLGPIIIKPKIMFQKLWKQNLQWDDTISSDLATEWETFRNKLHNIEEIRIPRWFGYASNNQSVELHGFCDASIVAYGAVIYIKSTDTLGNSQIQLILAKSRVAPVQTIRLPRLELCGGVLLANLISMVGEVLEIKTKYCWTDSTITLDWIDSTPDLYKTFVGNRVAEIQSLTNSKIWRHVEGTQNPADCLSRGLNPDDLKSHKLWWHGPAWLKYPKEKWPKNPNVRNPEDVLELKSKKVLTTVVNKQSEFLSELVTRYSSFQWLLRVTARMRLWSSNKRKKNRILLWKELENERCFWIRIAQEAAFSNEIKALKRNSALHEKSKLLAFYPFLDENGILRVGGRLKEALIEYDRKHQIVIPKESHIAKLIINDAHLNTKHGGTQLTVTYTRTQYWIMDTKNTVRNQIKRCVICHRYSKQTQQQLMGNLPKPRVNIGRAFIHTGVDYAGPMQILTLKKPGRRQTTKGYVAVFVCLSTKAVHLELVSDLTSEEFLASFTRFRSRRGLPSVMYSDNSLTFVGAKNELLKDYAIIKEKLEPELADILLKDNVQWSFIPPHAPHWGGIWEAGVKSMKFHLRRMFGESVHTFQEYATMLAEIEACLNSRPLCPVSNDPNDLSILTPGHFLIGDNLLAPPKPSLLDTHVSRLSKWKQISQKVEHFQKRWKAEYISQLQYRNKWMRQCSNVQVGDMVLIKEDGIAPSKWLLGRVVETFPDGEGLVRKVKIKTATTTLMRSINKVSILPIDKALEETTSN